jgi:SAM-dependent methyltransferase
MAIDDTHGLGYELVDDDPNVSVLLATMDTTAKWEATRRLRSWERSELGLGSGLGSGLRLLDVGCGLGEAALAFADDLGDDGEVVGVDVSAEMLRVARSKAGAARCRVRFTVGDACSLAEPDNSFDVVRSERTLQWLADPVAAVAEMARVVRPGGRVSLIDTDWSTFAIDVGDDALASMVRNAMRTERGRPSNIGRRLHELVSDADLIPVARAEATHTWTAWNPDETLAPDGCFSMQSLADDLVATDQLAPGERDRFVSRIHQAARRDRFSMNLTMYAVVATAPTP